MTISDTSLKHLYSSRINHPGDNLTLTIEAICDTYNVGSLTTFAVIETGYEDCNVVITTSKGKFMAKLFAKTRTADNIQRYVQIIQQALAAGVRHPELLQTPGEQYVFTTHGVSLILLNFVEGKAFYELNRAPTAVERRSIIKQAAKINQITHKPPYAFDMWAVPNIGKLYSNVKKFIPTEDRRLVERVLRQYKAIPVATLPHAFVHGDIIKTNVIKGEDDQLYLIDFSAANWYPRVQELAVIAANLLYDKNAQSLHERCEVVAHEYNEHIQLTPAEQEHLYTYTLAAATMEFLGAYHEKYEEGNNSEENNYWLSLGRAQLQKEVRESLPT